jgi:hypothetical protein
MATQAGKSAGSTVVNLVVAFVIGDVGSLEPGSATLPSKRPRDILGHLEPVLDAQRHRSARRRGTIT